MSACQTLLAYSRTCNSCVYPFTCETCLRLVSWLWLLYTDLAACKCIVHVQQCVIQYGLGHLGYSASFCIYVGRWLPNTHNIGVVYIPYVCMSTQYSEHCKQVPMYLLYTHWHIRVLAMMCAMSCICSSLYTAAVCAHWCMYCIYVCVYAGQLSSSVSTGGFHCHFPTCVQCGPQGTPQE